MFVYRFDLEQQIPEILKITGKRTDIWTKHWRDENVEFPSCSLYYVTTSHLPMLSLPIALTGSTVKSTQ